MYFPTTGFIQYVHFNTIAKGCEAIHKDHIHVLDKTVVTDGVVGDVVLHVLDHHVVTYRAVVKHRMTDTGMLHQPPGKGEHFFKESQFNLT
jgi:hypothetical protein